MIYERFGKRLVDLMGATFAGILTLPVQIVLAVLVRRKLGSPVLFAQERAGKDGTTFRLRKFRTMTDERDAQGELLPDEQRLTPFGQMLRSSSLDELPEIYNVLRGQMSLVGPRPLPTKYLPRYSATQARRHEVLPGITGWAQVNGRNSVSWDDKFEADVWYVDNVSFRLDVWIVLRTVVSIIKRDGISSEGHATAPEFKGSASRV